MRNTIKATILAFLIATTALAAGKIQNEDVKSLSDITGAGGTAAQLINDSKIYDTTNAQQLSVSIANGQLGGGGGGGVNLLSTTDNPGFESGTTGWTPSSGDTFTAISSGQLYGTKSGQYTASASGKTLYSALKSIVVGLQGNNCLAAISYSYASGTSGDYSLVVSDGTNVLASQSLNVTTTPQDAVASFVCPSSGSVKVGLLSNVASPNAIKIDGASFNGGSVLLGSNVLINNLSQASFYGSVLWPGGAGCDWSTTQNNTYTSFSANASCTLPAGGNIKGKASAPATKIPAIDLNALPPGELYVVGTGSFQKSGASLPCGFRFTDGTNNTDPNVMGSITGNTDQFGNIVGHFSYTTSGNREIQVQATGVNGSSTCDVNNTVSTIGFSIQVYFFPSGAQQAYSASQNPSSWSGFDTITSGWTTTSSSLVDPAAGSGISLTQTTSRNMVCTADASLPAISCPLNKSGMYRVKAIVTADATIGASLTTRLVDGTGTVISPGTTGTETGGNFVNLMNEGIYKATSPGSVTFKVQLATSGGTAQIIQGTPTGSAAIQWVIEDADAANSAPILVNSVTSSSTAVERVERVVFNGGGLSTACTSSPCTIASSTPGVSSVTRTGTGAYTINFSAGVFSSAPTCICTTDTSSAGPAPVCLTAQSTATSTAYSILYALSSSGTHEDALGNVICQGAH